ncbi:MAG: Gfo/Idh/MocA family protein [Acidimicrobiales bacterium]
MSVRVAVVGTSWWADTMYLPPLSNHPDADIVAVAGRDPDRAQAFAAKWGVPSWTTDPAELVSRSDIDAVVIATANDSHHPLAMAAIDAGLHILCEKPLALDAVQGAEMVDAAEAAGVLTMVPFTYHYMPISRWLKELIDRGWVGRPLHANIRYYTSFGFDTAYSWRFDRAIAGSGIIGDLGSHWVHLSRWLLDDTETSVSAVASTFIDREPRPDGTDHDPTEDSVAMTIRYSSGAYAVLHASSVCWEGTPFEQTHHLEIHGTEGTLYASCDWDTVQEVRGLKRGDSTGARILPIPDHVWGDVRRDTVHNTYRDVFRNTDTMTRQWISAIEAGSDPRDLTPDFSDGLAVQRVLDAAVRSAAEGGCPHNPSIVLTR